MRVVLATDGSDDARTATTWLRLVPLPPSTEVRVVCATVLPPSALDIEPVREYRLALVDGARHTAEEARARLADRWPAAAAEAVTGDPREEIPRLAEEWKADLIVVGARGLGGFASLLLGSVSTAVVRHARCPVLVVKGRPEALRAILIAVDGSPDSLAAARFVTALPLAPAVRVQLLGVVEPPHPPPIAAAEVAAVLPPAALQELADERRAELEGVLGRLATELRHRVPAVEHAVVSGFPAKEIAAAAADAGADLVVVGARGLGALERLLLGSVSERVLHQVDRPVLVVKHAGR